MKEYEVKINIKGEITFNINAYDKDNALNVASELLNEYTIKGLKNKGNIIVSFMKTKEIKGIERG